MLLQVALHDRIFERRMNARLQQLRPKLFEERAGGIDVRAVDFAVDGKSDRIQVFTSRPDTLFGATYMVLAPEHDLVDKITLDSHKEEVKKYRELRAKYPTPKETAPKPPEKK